MATFSHALVIKPGNNQNRLAPLNFLTFCIEKEIKFCIEKKMVFLIEYKKLNLNLTEFNFNVVIKYNKY